MRFSDIAGRAGARGEWLTRPVVGSKDALQKRLSEYARHTGRRSVMVRLRADAAKMPRALMEPKYGAENMQRIAQGKVLIRTGSEPVPEGDGWRQFSLWEEFSTEGTKCDLMTAFGLLAKHAEVLEVAEDYIEEKLDDEPEVELRARRK